MNVMFERGEPDILDVTLRDGSYLIDFQFTAEDTARIAAALESVGIRWIEVGHGLGLNASLSGKGRAAATDREYLEAASRAVQKARWGMFCIPGIARLDDLRAAAATGMSFVRVGTNITEVDDARPFIELGKELGLVVSYNAMKSYAVSPEEFARCAEAAGSWGADIVSLVDSAGGMFPEDIKRYIETASSRSDVRFGFHGHDNLAMSMANTLSAIDAGAVLVDASLQGMGRSAGNTVTEALAAILKRRGHLESVDLHGLMDIGQGLITPLMQGHALDPMAITSGYARFHSSFTSKVTRYAEKYGLDVRDLIVRLTQEDTINAPDELLDRLGRDLAAVRMPRVIAVPAFEPSRRWTDDAADNLRVLIEEIGPKAIKSSRFSTLNIVIAEKPMDGMAVSHNVHMTSAHVIGSVTLTREDDLVGALTAADGRVDVVFMDADRKPFGPASPPHLAAGVLRTSLLLTYSDGRIWVDAVEGQLVRMLDEDLHDRVVVIVGDHAKSRDLAGRIEKRNARVNLAPEADAISGDADAVIVWAEPSGLTREHAGRLGKDTVLLDAGIGTLSSEAIAEARSRGVLLVRVNIWPVLSGALEAAHESARVRIECLGWKELGGVPVVAGGAMGEAGAIVVDCINHPSRVIGVADGHGGVLYRWGPDDETRVRRVNEEILRRQVRYRP
jgi:4-hydroxy-2-oxovalerate aldolase